MIFNYCIYGNILPSYSGELTLVYYNRTLQNVKTKVYTVENNYQINLGDRDLADINHILENGESIVISVGNYFENIVLDRTKDIQQFDIDLNNLNSPSTTEASGDIETVRIVSDKITIEELDTNLYSYFEVQQNSEIVYTENGMKLNWIPKEDGLYTIIQRSYNKSNNYISEVQMQINILSNYQEIEGIDYIFYTKKNKIIQIELPEYVRESLLLDGGFYFEGDKLLGKVNALKPLELLYSRGKVIIKTQIGDILDY